MKLSLIVSLIVATLCVSQPAAATSEKNKIALKTEQAKPRDEAVSPFIIKMTRLLSSLKPATILERWKPMLETAKIANNHMSINSKKPTKDQRDKLLGQSDFVNKHVFIIEKLVKDSSNATQQIKKDISNLLILSLHKEAPAFAHEYFPAGFKMTVPLPVKSTQKGYTRPINKETVKVADDSDTKQSLTNNQQPTDHETRRTISPELK
jgi:hypothetical protein